jgi:exopolysaccharide biosynthesis protein
MNFQTKLYSLLLILFLLVAGSCSPRFRIPDMYRQTKVDGAFHIHLKSDTLFGSKQEIHLLMVPKNKYRRLPVFVGYAPGELMTTSALSEKYDAEAAINGGFFDRDKGGSVCYFETGNRVVSRTCPEGDKWAKSRGVVNGALVLFGNDSLVIEPARSEETYEKSQAESAVMVAGPLLIYQSKRQPLPNVSLSNDRNPRTCVGVNDRFIILATIDGRSATAAGMTLAETQKFFERLKCTSALNLDGGGSTALWIKGPGVVNHPSDREGERPVSDIVFVKRERR